MFKSLSMKQVDLFVLDKDLKSVGTILYDLKLMEFFQREKDGFEKHTPEDTSQNSSKLLSIRSTISFLENYYTQDTGELMDDPVEKVKQYQDKRKKLEKEISKLNDDEKRQKILVNLKVSRNQVENNKIIIGFIPKTDKTNIKQIESHNLISTYQLDDRIYFAVKNSKIPFSYKEFYLPNKVDINITLEKKDKEKKLKDIDFMLEKIANGNLTSLKQEELKLSKKLSIVEAKENFSKTQHVSVLSGFVPAQYVSKLKRSLEAELGDKFEMEVNEPSKNQDVPTILNNTGMSGNFENLLRMYSLPKYGEFDPSALMMLVFPLFYGFVLGDFGYGVISLIVFSVAKLFFDNIKSFLSVLQLSSISSMIFGVIYGEYFGFEPHVFPFEFHRSGDPQTLLAIAVIFGLVHLNIGLIIGFFNELKHSLKHAISDKLSWVLLQLGLLSLYLGNTTSLSSLIYLGTFVSIVSVILLYIGHGFMGIVEIPSFFTNILSYARLMAVGTSSIVIAMLINQYTELFFSMGVFGTVAGILLFTLGHIFNIILGNFESFLHTLRLHYVEFFLRFYEGGGRDFKPFGEKIYNEE